MVDIPWPTNSVPGARFQEGSGQLINAMCEQVGAGDNATLVRRRAPGLRKVAESASRVGCRGMRSVNGVVYVAYEDNVSLITGSGGAYTVTSLGSLPGNDPVQIAFNMKSPVPDVVTISNGNPYLLNISGPPTSYPDVDVGSPNSVCFIDGYFIFGYGDAKMVASDLNSTNINPLNFAYAQSRPDGILRVIPYRNEIFAMGPSSIEVWQNTGNPTGFPLSRSTVIPRGLISPWAVAGFEEGWANRLTWAADDGCVYTADGYSPVRISTHDVERSIKATNPADLRAIVYMADGHAIWQLKGPGFGWCYDFVTGLWHERKSYGLENPRNEASCFFDNRWLTGDSTTGMVYAVDMEYFQEGENPLIYCVSSAPLQQFPLRAQYARADFDFIVGYANAYGTSPMQTDPVVRISWSDDGGATFSQPVVRTLGREGDYQARISLLRTGQAGVQGRVWDVKISDAVYVALEGGACSADPRAE